MYLISPSYDPLRHSMLTLPDTYKKKAIERINKLEQFKTTIVMNHLFKSRAPLSKADKKKIQFFNEIISDTKLYIESIDDVVKWFWKKADDFIDSLKKEADNRIKLEGCLLYHNIPGYVINSWYLKTREQAENQVLFKIKMDKDCTITGYTKKGEPIYPEPIKPKKIKYASKPIFNWNNGLPDIPFKPLFSLKDVPHPKYINKV